MSCWIVLCLSLTELLCVYVCAFFTGSSNMFAFNVMLWIPFLSFPTFVFAVFLYNRWHKNSKFRKGDSHRMIPYTHVLFFHYYKRALKSKLCLLMKDIMHIFLYNLKNCVKWMKVIKSITQFQLCTDYTVGVGFFYNLFVWSERILFRLFNELRSA